MVESIINSSVDKAEIVLIGSNYDKTSSFRKGSDKGPEAIKKCLDRQIEFYERYSKSIPAKKFKIAYLNLGNLNPLKPEEMVNLVKKKYLQLKNKFIIIIGGEHSVTNAPLSAISEILASSSVTVVQIDAHLDMRDTDADYNDKPWGKYAHSCVMRRAIELSFKTVQIGIRAYSKEEIEFSKNKSRIFEWLMDKKPPEIEEIINTIKTNKVYLTIDVDGFDPLCMPATGTPVNGGLTWNYGNKLIREICKERKLVGADIVEVSPIPQNSLTEYSAAQLCYNIIAWRKK